MQIYQAKREMENYEQLGKSTTPAPLEYSWLENYTLEHGKSPELFCWNEKK